MRDCAPTSVIKRETVQSSRKLSALSSAETMAFEPVHAVTAPKIRLLGCVEPRRSLLVEVIAGSNLSSMAHNLLIRLGYYKLTVTNVLGSKKSFGAYARLAFQAGLAKHEFVTHVRK